MSNNLPLRAYPSCAQATPASTRSQRSSHTVPHCPPTQISTRPSYSVSPFTSRSAWFVQDLQNIFLTQWLQATATHLKGCLRFVATYNYLFSFSKFHTHHHDKMLQWKQQTSDCYLHAGSFLSQDRKGYPSSVTDVHLKGKLRFAAITTCSPSPNFTHISMTRCYNGNNRPVIVVFRQAVF